MADVSPIDQGAILRSGAALIPDLQAQLAQQQQIDIQRQQANTASLELRQRIMEDQREQETANSYAADLAAIEKLPQDQQTRAIIALMAKYPKQSEALKRSYDAQDENVKAADFKATAEVFSFVQNGAPDKAAALIRKRIAADKAAGLDTADDEEIASALESGDPAKVQQAAAQIGWQLSVAAGPEKFASIYGAIDKKTDWERKLEAIEQRYGKKAADNFALNDYDPFVESNNKYGTTFYRSSVLAGGGPAPQQGQGGAPPNSGEVSSGAPGADRGTRNNNPGNLKDGPFARRQPGYQGSDGGGFAVFASPSHGQKAQETLLKGNYLSKGHDTPRKIISRYAPSGENSSASMANYASYVARRLGIGVDDKIPAGKAGLLAQAMREFETGNTVKAAVPKKPVRVTSLAQARSLPSGTEFIDPKGVRRRVP